MFCICFSLSSLFFPFPFVKTNAMASKRRKTHNRSIFLYSLLNIVYTHFCTYCKVYHHFNFNVSCGIRNYAVATAESTLP